MEGQFPRMESVRPLESSGKVSFRVFQTSAQMFRLLGQCTFILKIHRAKEKSANVHCRPKNKRNEIFRPGCKNKIQFSVYLFGKSNSAAAQRTNTTFSVFIYTNISRQWEQTTQRKRAALMFVQVATHILCTQRERTQPALSCCIIWRRLIPRLHPLICCWKFERTTAFIPKSEATLHFLSSSQPRLESCDGDSCKHSQLSHIQSGRQTTAMEGNQYHY